MSGMILLIVALLAAPALAQDQPATAGLDLMSVVQALMGSVNVPVLAMLTVLAATLHRAQRITATTAITAPIAGGAILGALSAVARAQATAGGWLMVAQLSQAVLEGAIVNGGMAVIVGRLASVGLDRLWPSTGAQP